MIVSVHRECGLYLLLLVFNYCHVNVTISYTIIYVFIYIYKILILVSRFLVTELNLFSPLIFVTRKLYKYPQKNHSSIDVMKVVCPCWWCNYFKVSSFAWIKISLGNSWRKYSMDFASKLQSFAKHLSLMKALMQ